jgi:hypothetical protein
MSVWLTQLLSGEPVRVPSPLQERAARRLESAS